MIGPSDVCLRMLPLPLSAASQQEPGLLESVFVVLADFPLASTWSRGPAKQCCHKNRILSCKAALIGPDGSHAAGSSSFTKVKKTAGGDQKTEKFSNQNIAPTPPVPYVAALKVGEREQLGGIHSKWPMITAEQNISKIGFVHDRPSSVALDPATRWQVSSSG